jgi:SulP family sulfate permease
MTGGARSWSPLSSWGGLDWEILASAGVEIASIAGVSIASLLLDASSLEVQRRTQADMDTEFRLNGAANLSVMAVGGFPVGLALNPSRLTDILGGRGRAAGVAAGLLIGLLLFSGIDLASLVPRPVLGGMLIFLGIGIVLEGLKVPGRRSSLEFALTLLIMGAIVGLGYLTGIILGIIGACLLFAARYSRIGVIRRHVTRAELAAPVERRPDVARLLSEQGGRIHVLWLNGYLFFGSSNGLFESIRGSTASRGLFGRRWVVLDCSAVTGIDGSAVLSFQKLANWAAAADVTLVFAAASAELLAELSAASLFDGTSPARHFATRNEALEWAEDRLAESAGALGGAAGADGFEHWLARELGDEGAHRLVTGYLERHELEAGEIVCALGAPADTIELVAAGSVAVVVPGLRNGPIRVRRMTGCTVVGEMGFFRRKPRAASVIAEEPAVVYVLTRTAYERLLATEPALCATVLQFVVRAMSDRLEAANREIGALL